MNYWKKKSNGNKERKKTENVHCSEPIQRETAPEFLTHDFEHKCKNT